MKEPKAITPAKFAEQMGVSVDAVLGWIRSGELTAINVASSLGKRPRWKIMPEEIESFLLRRSSQASAKQPMRKRTRNRKRAPGFIDYFPQGDG